MRVLISMRVAENAGYKERRDALAQEWISFLRASNAETTVVPVLNDPDHARRLASDLHPKLILLSGGNDLGEASERDATESALIAYAQEKKVPLLGTCRGLQMINHFFGGKITQDLPSHGTNHHVAVRHRVGITEGAFRAIYGESLEVNSFHNHGLLEAGLAPSLRPFAWSADGVIEGVAHEALPIAAIQWHPERETAPSTKDLTLVRALAEKGKFW